MRIRVISLLLLLAWISQPAKCHSHEARHYVATELTVDPPQIDGILDDGAWQHAVWQSGFIQHEPYNGREASQETLFAVLFDNNYIYVAIRAYDSSPDSIVCRRTRRDQADGDKVGIAFDSYHDLRTGFVFGVSAGGTRFDWLISNDGQQEDHSWDPNWWVKTHVDDEGWTAEMRIPFSQLRFERNGGRLWGMQVFREIHRNSELSFWSHIPKDAPGLVHRFGTLDGLGQIEPRSIFDVTPYTVALTDRYLATPGNPFQTGHDDRFKLGVDSKIGLSNYLTLDLTLNPDFGQVEADPSEVNLTAFETFFEEKRPFFIEGRNIMSFGLGIGDGGIGNDNLFYSRRIGRRPLGNIQADSGAYVDKPSFTNILGAAKISGKTDSGLSIALMESLTSEANATIDLDGERSMQLIEPLTNFFVGRLQQDFRDGSTIIGGMFTSVNRRLDENLALQMHRNAYTAGVDVTQFFRDKSFMVNVNAAFSHVAGEKEAILHTQRSSARYFQIPDEGMMRLDPERTSLTGSGGRIQVGKMGDGHWNFMAAMLWKSPQFEINDIGYMRESDNLFQVAWIGYRQWEPKGIYREYRINFNQYRQWNFNGDLMLNGMNVNGFIRYRNFWSTSMGVEYARDILSKSLLRGGPMFQTPNLVNAWARVGTDNRKKLTASLTGSYNHGMENYQQARSASASLTYKPIDNLNLSFAPSWSRRSQAMQFVGHRSIGSEQRYLFGSMEQEVISFSFRVNLTLLPDLTLQYWGQPFVAAGSYNTFKYVTDPRAGRFDDRYAVFTDNQIGLSDGVYRVDENLDGTIDYMFGKPDFRVREFLSNLVLRWEYSPGSSLYLVWSQDRNNYEVNGPVDYFHELNSLFSEKPSNTFLLKFSYRIGLR